jgi:hypothetical protein
LRTSAVQVQTASTLISGIFVRRQRRALFRDRRPADAATQPLELLALIRPRRHAGVQGESRHLADPVIEGLITHRQRLQREHVATLLAARRRCGR